MTSDELREIVKHDIDNEIITIAELARAISRSSTYVSLWLRKKSTWNTGNLESLLRVHYRNKNLSLNDQRLMDKILDLLGDADDKQHLIEAISTSFN